MVSAREIVNLLLEADDAEANAPSQPMFQGHGVWIFGPDIRPKGYTFNNLGHMVSSMQRYGKLHADPNQPPEDILDELVQGGYTIFHNRGPDETIVYAKALPLRTVPEIAEQVKGFLRLEDDSPVIHRKSFTDGTGKTVPAEYALLGSKEIEQAQRQKEKESDQQRVKVEKEREARLRPIRNSSGEVVDRYDPDEKIEARPQPKVTRKTPVPRYSIGISVDEQHQPVNDAEKGVLISAVHPGGPAALAHLQAGDLIKHVEFEIGDTTTQALIHEPMDLAQVLQDANPKSPMNITLYRADKLMTIPVEMAEKQQDATHIPAEEVQRWASAQPNEQQPASKTGNQPPNVSTLT